jgi:hypothetical protein
MSVESDAIQEEQRLWAAMQAAIQPFGQFWRNQANAPRIAGLAQPIQDIGRALDQLYAALFAQASQRLTEIAPPGAAPYDINTGLELLNNQHNRMEALHAALAPMTAGHEADPYCQQFIQSFDDLRTRAVGWRDSLADRAVAITHRAERARLIALKRSFRDFLHNPPPANADAQTLADYEIFLRERLREIDQRLIDIRPVQNQPRPYDIAAGIRLFLDLQSKFDQQTGDLQAQLQQADKDRRKNKKNSDPQKRAEAAAKARTINYINRKMHNSAAGTVANGSKQLLLTGNHLNPIFVARMQGYTPQPTMVPAPPQQQPAAPVPAWRKVANQICKPEFLVGVAVGAITRVVVTKVAFAIAAAALVSPVGLAGLGIGIAIGATTGILTKLATSAIFGKPRQKGWWWKSALLGGTGGGFGYGLTHLIMGGDLFDHSGTGSGPQPSPTPTPTPEPSALDHAKDLLKNHLPQGHHFDRFTQGLIDKATSDNASALDVMKACKEVSFAEIDLPGHTKDTAKFGYELIKDGWQIAKDNTLTSNPWGKMLGLDWGYGQDIGAPGVPKNHQAAIDLAKEIGWSSWMKGNPWRAALKLG